MRIRDLMEFWRRSRARLRSMEDYQAFQVFQARRLVGYLRAKDVDLEGSTVLDLGSGFGGYSQVFAENRATVFALDNLALRFPRIDSNSIYALQGEALALPLAADAFDFVFCASLVEHVPNPARLLDSIYAVLRPGGLTYISFPPFYSLRGGHECSPFHYFGMAAALKIRNRRDATPAWLKEIYSYPDSPTSYADLYLGHGLYKLTIHSFLALLEKSQFSRVDMSTRFLPFSFVRWPLLGEVLTWHAQFLLRKPV